MDEKNPPSRLAVYIDGSNFYHKLRSLDISHLSLFDYRGLVEWLAVGRAIVLCNYYVGLVRTKTTNEKGQLLRPRSQPCLGGAGKFVSLAD
ncbi:MAG: hypothetical protein WC862_01465 [Patescibacteria group bacterium]